tara:strand:- start:171 stop:344 length:174 start_codon:yes stop_codon:yes gene_type:complete
VSIPKFHGLNIQNILADSDLRSKLEFVLVRDDVHLSPTLRMLLHAERRRLRLGVKVE